MSSCNNKGASAFPLDIKTKNRYYIKPFVNSELTYKASSTVGSYYLGKQMLSYGLCLRSPCTLLCPTFPTYSKAVKQWLYHTHIKN